MTAAGALARRRRVVSRGLSFTLSCESAMTAFRWRSFNDKEPETLDWLDGCVRDGDLFLDVGANVGVYSLYAALRHLRVRVVAVEPEYGNLHVLRDNILANRLHDRVHVYAIALSDHTGLSRLHIQDAQPGAALHSESRQALSVTEAGAPVLWSEGLWAMRLDDFCDALDIAPNAIKIDVDGGEHRILEGAVRTLKSPALRTVLVEMGPGPVGARGEALLADAGFRRRHGPLEREAGNQIWVRASGTLVHEEVAG